jgi:hypothetical protein
MSIFSHFKNQRRKKGEPNQMLKEPKGNDQWKEALLVVDMHHKCTHTLLSIIIITNDYNYQLFNQLATYGNKERCNNSKPKLGINFSRNSKFKSLWGSLWPQHVFVLWAFLQKILIHLDILLHGVESLCEF